MEEPIWTLYPPACWVAIVGEVEDCIELNAIQGYRCQPSEWFWKCEYWGGQRWGTKPSLIEAKQAARDCYAKRKLMSCPLNGAPSSN